MFDHLSEKLSNVFSKMGLKKRLSEENIQEGLREIRLALIEADVNLSVIKTFIADVKEKALGQEVIKNVRPVDQFIKIVSDGIYELLGGSSADELALAEPTQISTVLMAGLQGSGKTTTVGKMARRFKEKRRVLTVSLDIYRPAANEQLKIVSEQAGVSFYDRTEHNKNDNLKKIIKDVLKYAKKHDFNLVFFDTAGRTQVDEAMLDEIRQVQKEIKPFETLFVADSMTGQSALDVAKAFSEAVKITGLVFTKFDSDTRGGVVLSVKNILSVPVRYVGTGESIKDLDLFDAKRISERMLGMGDIVGLVNKAQESIDEDKAEKIAKRMSQNQFDLQDFLDQLEQIGNMGSLESIMKMIPGMSQQMNNMPAGAVNDKDLKKMRSLIQSMTPREREQPFVLNNSRKLRVARGAGHNILAVNQLLKRYNEMKSMMKKMNNPKKMKKMMGSLGMDTGAMSGMGAGMNGMPGSPGGMGIPGGGLPNDQMAALEKFMKKNKN